MVASRDRDPASPTAFPELNELLRELVRRVKAILGDSFVGAYLQGYSRLETLTSIATATSSS